MQVIAGAGNGPEGAAGVTGGFLASTLPADPHIQVREDGLVGHQHETTAWEHTLVPGRWPINQCQLQCT